MLPFVAIDESRTGPFNPYGVCCALAFFVWDWVLLKMAVRRGYDRADARVLTVFLGVFGWAFAWGVDAVFYPPVDAIAAAKPGGLTGFSSTGAIVGATVGSVLWARLVHVRKEAGRWRITRRAEPHALLPLSELILSTWPLAWAIGRLGCAIVHDHIGKAVAPGSLGSLIAVGIPRGPEDGVHRTFGPVHVFTGGSDVRYDLGLIELFVLSCIAIGFASTWRRKVAIGTYTMVGSLIYGPLRFLLDFLRASEGVTGEARHAGLTFAQYWSLAVIAVGVTLLVRRLRARDARSLVAAAVVLVIGTIASEAAAAERYIDRAMTLRKLEFAGDVGLGLVKGRLGPPFGNTVGAGLNLEGALGITDNVELGLRTGVRFDDEGRGLRADQGGRTLWTETYGTGNSTFANPEFRVRWVAYAGSVTEVGLDGRMYLPFESGTRIGMMFGVPLHFHVADFLRIDTGPYIPVVFNRPDVFAGITMPGYFWFQPSEKLWLGPMSALRILGEGNRNAHLLLGFGLGYQVASSVDLKTWVFFPTIDDDPGRSFVTGFGVQFRIND